MAGFPFRDPARGRVILRPAFFSASAVSVGRESRTVPRDIKSGAYSVVSRCVCVCVCVFHILCHLNLWAREDMSLGTVQDPLGLLLFSSHPRNAIITGQQRPNNSKDCCQSNRPARIVTGVQLRFAAEPCQGTLATALPCWCELPSHLWPPLRSPTKPVLVCGFTTCTPSRAGRLNYYRKCQRQALRTTHTRKPRRLSCFCRLAGASDNNLLAEAPTSSPLPSEDRSQKRVGQDLPSYPFQGFCGFPASVYVSVLRRPGIVTRPGFCCLDAGFVETGDVALALRSCYTEPFQCPAVPRRKVFCLG